MMIFETILCSFAFIFVIVGLSEILHRIWIYFLTPSKSSDTTYLITFLSSSSAPQRIRADLEKIRWAGRKEYSGLICVNCGLDEQTASVCRQIANENEDLFFFEQKVSSDFFKEKIDASR